MAQNNKFKTYIRIDASGRDVPSSNVLRKSRPKVGRWREATAYECCNPITIISSTPADVTLTNVVFTVSCDATVVGVHTIVGANTTDINDLVDKLNASFSFYGQFEVIGSAVTLAITPEIMAGLCPDGTVTFTIA